MSIVRIAKRQLLASVRKVSRWLYTARRRAAPLTGPTSRVEFLAGIDDDLPILEIGPFNCPQLRGRNVAYFDVLDQTGLRARALEHLRDPKDCPPIDFVSATGDMSIIDRYFATIFSCHAIEHQPDLIAHLQAIDRILLPGGRLCLIVPDKRYCFDHFIPETTLADVIDAHVRSVVMHTPRSIFLHRLFVTHNDSIRHWLGLHGSRPRPGSSRTMLSEALAEQQKSSSGSYVDVHGWYFTPSAFAEVMHCLASLKLTALELETVHVTSPFEQEFFAILKKPR